jgi:4-amino-4-deoxy-L-arabinose transferase-like glycosyltransferase
MALIDQLLSHCRRHPNWMALLTFTAIVGLFHWPLVLRLSTHVVGRPFDDVFGILWGLDWAQQALFAKQVSPFFMPDVFYPHGFYVSSSSPPVWWFVVLSPLTRLLGPVITYNVSSLLVYILAGLGMYFLVTYLGGKWLAGILAGSIYIAAPVLTIRLGGHIDILLSLLWLPYLALFSHKAVQEPGLRTWLPTGLLLGLSCLGHWQFVFFAPLLPLAIIGLGQSHYSLRQRMVLIVKIGATAMLVVLPFLAITVYARSQMYTDTPSFSMAAANAYSLSFDRLFVPNPLNSIWGEWSSTTFPVSSEASAISIGYAAVLVSIIGMLSKWPQRRSYLVLLLVVLIGAIGITLHWNEKPVVLPLPSAWAGSVRPLVESIVGPELMPAGEATVIPLPLAFINRIFPILSLTRVWARYMIVGMLAIGVLAGLGATAISQRFPRFAHLVVALIIGVVLLEGLVAPYRDFTEVSTNQRPVDRWLADQQLTVSLIEYPLPHADKLSMYRQSIHRQRLVNGYASIVPTYFVEALPTLGTWPNPAGVDLLRSWRVDYVLVNGNLNDAFQKEILPMIQAVDGLCLTRIDTESERNRQTLLFRVVQDGQACAPTSRGSLYGQEHQVTF